MADPISEKWQGEPVLLEAARRMAEREPTRHIRIVAGTGMTVRGFVADVDEWVARLLADQIDWKARHEEHVAALAALAGGWLSILTEGPERDGTARMRECCRDVYSLSIEEAQEAITNTIADPAAVLADRDRRVKAEATADALTVAAVLLRRVFDYWEGRPISMHAGHLWDDFRGVLTAIERDAEHNRRDGGRADD